MQNMKNFKDYINESKAKTVGIFSGRFQPCTKAHAEIIEKIGKENDSGIIFLVKGKKTSEDKEKNPFDTETQKKMLELVTPKNVKIEIISTGFFVDELNKSHDTKFVAYAGSDRVKAYKSFNKYIENDNTLEIKEIKRTDEDISATKVREALKNNNKDEFKKLTPVKIHGMFKELKEILGK